MKIDRLIGIIAVLQNNKRVTAPYLAEKFEVSRRTINRDIDEICMAGIPIVTTQGKDGGISIMDGYKLDTSVFTAEELQAIFIGLKSLDSISHKSHTKLLAEKMSADKNAVFSLSSNIAIDLSSHYKDSLVPKIEMIKKAISEKKLISFRYYYNKGEDIKTIEPYLIIFKWSAWYVFGYCTKRCDFRLFKMNRLWDLTVVDMEFLRREISDVSLDLDRCLPDNFMITAIFDETEKYRLVENYGPDSFSYTNEGRLLFSRGFTNISEAIAWFLSFGDNVEVIEPYEIRSEIKKIAENILNKYK